MRRGPDPPSQEPERILGTPDYLAPEILKQNNHGMENICPAIFWTFYDVLVGVFCFEIMFFGLVFCFTLMFFFIFEFYVH